MKSIKTIYAVFFAVLAGILIPAGALSFTAAETVLLHVTVEEEGTTLSLLTASSTVEDALRELGVRLNEHDLLSHALTNPLWYGITITIERQITVNYQINSLPINTRNIRPDLTVGNFLIKLQQEQEISLLFEGDTSRRITDGETLNFITWSSRFDFQKYYVPFEIVENFTGAVSLGRSHVRIPGEYGENETTTAIVYVGGTEVNREYMGTTVLRPPVDEVIDIGTGWLGSLTDVTRYDFHYFRRVRMEATAYTAGYCCTGKHPDDPWYGITASGRRVEHGIVAVDRNVIPLGTRLYVENYGFAIAADVGGAIRGMKIDLFMEDLQDALRFGRRHIYVWILDEIPWDD